jgi:membrane fusion protein, multidrug efflux system
MGLGKLIPMGRSFKGKRETCGAEEQPMESNHVGIRARPVGGLILVRIFTSCLAAIMGVGLAGPLWPADAQGSHSKIPVKAIQVMFQTEKKSTIPGMGTLQCAEMLDVGFEVTGTLTKLPVKPGDRVQEGDVIAELDNSVLDTEAAVKEAEIKAAVSQLAFRSEEYAKREELFKRAAVSDSELKKAKFEMEKAQADLETAQAQQASISARKQQRILKSPVSGIVAKRYVETGAVVTPGVHRVLRLLRCQELTAVIELGEKAYTHVRPGQRITIQVDALGGKKFVTEVSRVCPEIDKKNRTFTIEARIDNPDAVMTAGMFCQVNIEPPNYSEQSLWIPKKALLPNQGEAGRVYVVKNGIAVSRSVQIGTESADRVQILGGLKEQELVIVAGHENMPEFTEVLVSIQGNEP